MRSAAEAIAPEICGDTAAQGGSVPQTIKSALFDLALQGSDVFRMQVCLVGPDGAQVRDFAGFMAGPDRDDRRAGSLNGS